MPILGQTQPRLEAGAAMCVRNVNVLLPAIHINSRSWLRSSSIHEPSDPPLGVVFCLFCLVWETYVFRLHKSEGVSPRGATVRSGARSSTSGGPFGRLLTPASPKEAPTTTQPGRNTRSGLRRQRRQPLVSDGLKLGFPARGRGLLQQGARRDALGLKARDLARL